MHMPSLFTTNKSARSATENGSEGDADKPSNTARFLARMAPRPQSSSGDHASSRGSTTPDLKTRRLTKSASSNMLRKQSPSSPRVPSSPRLQSSSTMLPERPRTRDSSPASRVRMMEPGRRAASATVSGSLSTPSPGPISNPSSYFEAPDRGRLLNRMSFRVKSQPPPKDRPAMPSMSHTTAKLLGGGDYDTSPLLCGERVNELWADYPESVLVYLFGDDKPASFKVPASILDASPTLNALAFNRGMPSTPLHTLPEDDVMEGGRETPPVLSPGGSSEESLAGALHGRNGSPPNLMRNPLRREGHLYLPAIQQDDFVGAEGWGEADRLIAARNLFAFLLSRPLVATKRLPTEFQVLLSIAKQLKEMGFYDESIGDFGLSASAAFKGYMNQFTLQDVRGDKEKILKAVILGEEMRSTDLYYEAFTHLVGNFTRLGKEKAKWYGKISANTRQRLERESHDLEQWQSTVNRSLGEFEFPHLFNGSAQSKVTAESRVVRFAAWKQNFGSFRSFTLSYYKDLYGAWPPKATKKNGLTIGGLNRIVLQQLYEDFCSLYDLLVDRKSLSPRKLDMEEDGEEEEMTENELQVLALRKIMSEHDRSTIPLSPPIQFDLPRLPSITTIDAASESRTKMEQNANESRKLKYFETTLIMAKAHNMDQGITKPFLQAYTTFEQKEATGKSVKELRDMRLGHWLLMYAILQRLPLLVVDAPDLRFTEGVEYFLCKPPYGPPPWYDHGNRMLGSEQAASTPEGIFQRSHCWIVANKLLHDLQLKAPQELEVDIVQTSPYLGSAVEDQQAIVDAHYMSPKLGPGMYDTWQSDYESPPPINGFPLRTDSMIIQPDPYRQSAMPDYGYHTRSSSQPIRTVSGTEAFGYESPVGEAISPGLPSVGSFGNMTPYSNIPYSGGVGIMRPPSRPGSGYFGPGGIASRPSSRPTSRPPSRAAFLDEEYKLPPNFGGNTGNGFYRGNFGNMSTPQLSSTGSGSVSDPNGSVLGAGNHSRSVSQTRTVRMGPSTFEDILENMDKNGDKKKKKKSGLLSVGDRKSRGRLSFWNGSGSTAAPSGSSTG